jgi:hypothetical protein
MSVLLPAYCYFLVNITKYIHIIIIKKSVEREFEWHQGNLLEIFCIASPVADTVQWKECRVNFESLWILSIRTATKTGY